MAKSYKRWVTDLVATMSDRMNLHQWNLHVYFEKEYQGEDEDTTAWVYVDSRYLAANIHFLPAAEHLWKQKKMRKLEECVVHEMMHIFLGPLHEFAKQAASPQTQPQLTDILEQATQRLTRIVIANTPKKIFSVN